MTTTQTTTKMTITVRNTDNTFGEAGPFEVESIDAFVAEMAPTFRRWATEAWDAMAPEDRDEDRDSWMAEKIQEMECNFRLALEVVEE